MINRFEGNGRMSKVVEHNGILYLCGQTSDPEHYRDAYNQTVDVLRKCTLLLEQHNSDKNHILQATIYLKDMSLFEEMNKAWDNWIENGNEPARACVESKLASDKKLVEIVMIAATK